MNRSLLHPPLVCWPPPVRRAPTATLSPKRAVPPPPPLPHTVHFLPPVHSAGAPGMAGVRAGPGPRAVRRPLGAVRPPLDGHAAPRVGARLLARLQRQVAPLPGEQGVVRPVAVAVAELRDVGRHFGGAGVALRSAVLRPACGEMGTVLSPCGIRQSVVCVCVCVCVCVAGGGWGVRGGGGAWVWMCRGVWGVCVVCVWGRGGWHKALVVGSSWDADVACQPLPHRHTAAEQHSQTKQLFSDVAPVAVIESSTLSKVSQRAPTDSTKQTFLQYIRHILETRSSHSAPPV